MLHPISRERRLSGIAAQVSQRRMALPLAVGACSAMMVVACGAQPDTARPDVIAFTVAHDEDDGRIMEQSRRSSEMRQVPTPRGLVAGFPSYSSDGSKMTFVATSGDDGPDGLRVYVMNIDGSEARVVADPTVIASGDYRVGFPSFSPDDAEIAFTAWDSDAEPPLAHYIVGVDGNDLRRLPSPPIEDANADPDRLTFSPDGETIVYSHATDGRYYDLYSLDVRGGEPTIILETDSVEPLMPAFAPDGDRIAYTVQKYEPGDDLPQPSEDDTDWWTRGDADTAIFVADSDGSDPRRITDWGDAGRLDRLIATWSPDGSRIAFSGPVPDDTRTSVIFIVDIDGTGLERITPEDDLLYFAPSWR